MPDLGIGEIAIIALVIFALFGYKRLPDAARSLGRSMRVFRAETRGLKEDDVRGKAEARVTTRGPLGDETRTGEAAGEARADAPTAEASAKPTVVDAEPEPQPAKRQAGGS